MQKKVRAEIPYKKLHKQQKHFIEPLTSKNIEKKNGMKPSTA